MQRDNWVKLAILYDEKAKYSPSNDLAIERFCDSAIRNGIDPFIITKMDLDDLNYYDSLFIRETTNTNDHTFDFAIKAEILNMKVIDSPKAIMLGCNKISQLYAFENHLIPFPNTLIIGKERPIILPSQFHWPVVIKLPNSCFSQGVFLANNPDDYSRILESLFSDPNTRSLICQEFIKTEFDWRIGIFEHRILYACKYHMADQDWKIIKYDRKGELIDGKHEAIDLLAIPDKVREVALKCCSFLDDGLYGIDIKETKDRIYVMEINDNPSIDAGVEDGYLNNILYDSIITYFK